MTCFLSQKSAKLTITVCRSSDLHTVEVGLVDKIVRDLSKNKSPGSDGLVAEHRLYFHPCVIVIIAKLLNLMMIYEYLPDDFRFSVTFPIPKGSKNSVSKSSSDYRGISISPIISKIYEYCVLDKFKSFLYSSPLQFGFKKEVGCTQAIYTLQKNG